MLSVTVYDTADGNVNGEAYKLEVDYVSLVNGSTYGPPPLIAPTARSGGPDVRAEIGEEVFYVNTSLVPAFKIERISD